MPLLLAPLSAVETPSIIIDWQEVKLNSISADIKIQNTFFIRKDYHTLLFIARSEKLMEILTPFIAIEGIDGAGKSTQATLLKEALEKLGKKVVLTTEPTTSKIGCLLREVLAGKFLVHPKTAAHLFACDRAEHLYGQDGVTKLCKSGTIVISDRYLFSSLAYQKLSCGDDTAQIVNSAFPWPFILIYVRLSAKEAMKRVAFRAKAGATEREIYEKQDFQEKLYTEYEKIIAKAKEVATLPGSAFHLYEVDGSKSEEEVCKGIVDFVKGVL